MTTEELARALDGRPMDNEMTNEECRDAMESGLVVVYGYSDDCVEFRGAVHDQVSAYRPKKIPITPDGLLTNLCDDPGCPYFIAKLNNAAKLSAECGADGWKFDCSWPHSTFHVFEGVDLFCTGIVFRLADVPATEETKP